MAKLTENQFRNELVGRIDGTGAYAGKSYSERMAIFNNSVSSGIPSSPVSFSSNDYGSFLNSLIDSFNSSQSSAMQAQIDMIREQNAFNAGQAALNRAFQQQSAERAMQFEKEQAKVAMDFSERMRDTQYQAAVRDLQKAGLNPILAYQNLNSSAPTGVSASGVAASGSMASSSGSNISSALKIDKSDILSAIVSMFLAKENNSAAMDRAVLSNVLRIFDIF